MFYLYMKQSGEGCDYTIGCGAKFKALKASTREEAEKEVAEAFDYHGLPRSRDRGLSEALLLDVKNSIDMLPLLAKLQKEVQDERAKEERASKREQFEKLKRELGEE